MADVCTTCPYCGVGCGIVASVSSDKHIKISGDKTHPANRGRLCSKGTHLAETLVPDGRLLHPEIQGTHVDWETALTHVAEKFSATIEEHGPDSVAFYVSGQLLTEDYYVANKLMKGFIGSGNIDTNSRLCMASAVAAHVRAFGEDVVPCSYDDLDEADLIILVGSNTAWCHPVVWQRIEAARERRGTKLVVIDPRRTETAAQADLHLAIAPDGDIALFNAALLHLKRKNLLDHDFIDHHVNQPTEFWTHLKTGRDGLDDDARNHFFALLEQNTKTVTLFSQGVNQSVSGTDKANAIINLHLVTGRISRSGMGPFSITGQPNAMGGREVGGLASMLAAHMGFSASERDRLQRFWQSPNMCIGPGLKAVDMFDAVADGRIKAIWIMCTNPAVSMPDASTVRAALAACPLVVVSDCIAESDTTKFAHVKLPATGWSEKDGTVTNSERLISRQRAFLAPAGEAKADWWIIAEVAKRMGWADHFNYPDVASIFSEYAALTGFENDGSRVLDISDKTHNHAEDYESMLPFQWGKKHPFANGEFPTENKRANLVLVTPQENSANPEHPLRLNTGRYRDQWHTMTRTGLSPKLSVIHKEPVLEIHPDDLSQNDLTDGGLAQVETASGSSIFRVHGTKNQRPGDIFVPIHWSDTNACGGRTGLLPGKERDTHSGQPAFKNISARVRPVRSKWVGFLVSQTRLSLPQLLYHVETRFADGWLYDLAGSEDACDIIRLLPQGEQIETYDAQRGARRIVLLDNGRLNTALFIAPEQRLLPLNDWLLSQLAKTDATPIELLAGRSAKQRASCGAIVCVCFGIGKNTILKAIETHELKSVQEIGSALNAGTNCGSCRPALSNLLVQQKELQHA